MCLNGYKDIKMHEKVFYAEMHVEAESLNAQKTRT